MKNSFKETMEKFVAIDNAFLFMSSVENTTAYWKQFFYDVIAMSKQQGIPKYQERCSLLNNNPALVARYFQYKTGVFFKEIILDGSLGKTKYYAIRIKFQENGSPHIHSFVWNFDAPNIKNEAAYIEIIEKTINAPLADHSIDP